MVQAGKLLETLYGCDVIKTNKRIWKNETQAQKHNT